MMTTGIIAKWFTWGIPLHEGHLFGILNKIINLFACIALLVAIGMGFVSWIKRTKYCSKSTTSRKKTSIYITHNMFNCIRITNAIIWIITLSLVFIIELIYILRIVVLNNNALKVLN